MCAKARAAVTSGNGNALRRGSCFAGALSLVALSCAPSQPSAKSTALNGPARDFALATSAEAGKSESGAQAGKPGAQAGKPGQAP